VAGSRALSNASPEGLHEPWLTIACCFLAGAAQAEQLDLKTGVWEITTSGGPLPRPLVEKECVTKVDIAQKNGPDKGEDEECANDKPPTIAGKTWSAEKRCPGGRRVRAEFTAETSEGVKGSITILPGTNQKATTVQISAKWLPRRG
jgi:hypothetical protein